eukprot:scaffold55039_cov42-Phaeocystis_antarctica.AAC.1
MPFGPKFLPFLSLPPRANMPLRGSTTAVFLPVTFVKFTVDMQHVTSRGRGGENRLFSNYGG